MKHDILLDIHNVLADFNDHLLRAVWQATGVEAEHSDIKHDDFRKCFGLNELQADAVREHILRPGWARSIPPIHKAVEAAKELIARSPHTVTFVTRPWYGVRGWRDDVDAWVADIFGRGADKLVIHAYDKSKVQGTLMVEDSLPNLDSWLAASPLPLISNNRWGFLVDQPYNRESTTKHVRVQSLADVLDYL